MIIEYTKHEKLNYVEITKHLWSETRSRFARFVRFIHVINQTLDIHSWHYLFTWSIKLLTFTRDKLTREYQTNQTTCNREFDIMTIINVYAKQTFFWLRTTNIFNWMMNLKNDKKMLKSLSHAVFNDKHWLKF